MYLARQGSGVSKWAVLLLLLFLLLLLPLLLLLLLLLPHAPGEQVYAR